MHGNSENLNLSKKKKKENVDTCKTCNSLTFLNKMEESSEINTGILKLLGFAEFVF